MFLLRLFCVSEAAGWFVVDNRDNIQTVVVPLFSYFCVGMSSMRRPTQFQWGPPHRNVVLLGLSDPRRSLPERSVKFKVSLPAVSCFRTLMRWSTPRGRTGRASWPTSQPSTNTLRLDSWLHPFAHNAPAAQSEPLQAVLSVPHD